MIAKCPRKTRTKHSQWPDRLAVALSLIGIKREFLAVDWSPENGWKVTGFVAVDFTHRDMKITGA